MVSINTFIFDGNLVRDPVSASTTSGKPVTRYTVAVSETYRVGDELRERIDFIPVTVYGRQAECDARYLGKGHGVTVQARVRSWFDPETGKGGLRIVADVVKYQRKPAAGGTAQGEAVPESAPPAADDDWLDSYEREEAAAH